jgi:hypothetical protein
MGERMADAGTTADRDPEASGAGGLSNHPLQPPDKALDHAWRYFALHAQQRISVFSFFVVLSGILATGIGAGLQAGKPMAPVVAILGALLALFSFVFYRLDRRGSELVKLAEDAIVASEERCMPSYARIVAEEGKRRISDAATRTWTFGRSFKLMFWVMGIAGLVVTVCSLYRWAT